MKFFINATFISCEEFNQCHTVMGVDRGKIVYLGDHIPPKLNSQEVVDLGGQCVVPAFADTHLHFESFALFHGTVDVRNACNFGQMKELFAAYCAANPKAKFVPAFGCCAHTVKEGRLIQKKDLDEMVSLPALVVKYDGHAAVANSALLSQLPEEVIRDPGFDGETGWLYQNAFYLGVNYITEKIAPLKILQNLIDASDLLAKKGIGLLHTVEGVGYKNNLDVDTIVLASRGLPQVFRIFFQTMEIKQVLKRRLPRLGGCFRLALDGCFGSEDAALREPYANRRENTGFLAYTQQEVNGFCIRANRSGLQISMHAIGDAAVEQALNAYEAALLDFPREDHRHTIIHADLMPEELQEKAARLGVLISAQPVFLDWEQEPEAYLRDILGTQRVNAMLPLRSWVEKGIRISAGSDAPCTIPDPIHSIYCCCNHPNPAERLDILDALRMHTSWAAYACFDENKHGTLQLGKAADFTVLNKNPLELPAQALRELQVTDMYFGGKRYEKPVSGPLALAVKALFARKK